MYQAIKPFLFLTLLLLATLGCKKDQHNVNGPINGLNYQGDKTIKVNQEVTIIDSTAINDSALYNYPPGNRLYKWTIDPTDDHAVFSGAYTHGIANIIFNQPGNYQISAVIFDSLGQHQLGQTTAVLIQVLKDTLLPAVPLQPSDTLVFFANTYQLTPDSFYVFLSYSTVKSYEYVWSHNGVIMTGNVGPGISLTFSDSVTLNSFPFAYGYGTTGTPSGVIGVAGGFFNAAPAPLSITWLNKTYTGSMSVNNTGALSFIWPSAGAVIVKTQ
jgi:hypothetical protein